MKNFKFILFSLCALFLAPHVMKAQEEAPRMDDKERIALTAVVLDESIPAGARKQLENKMSQLAAKNGCAATSNSRFVITCSADVLTKDITPTAPPMHAYTVMLNFYVGDGIEGRLFSSYSIESKGVGQTPDKAYIDALKSVRVNDPGLKSMIETGKKEIIAYYNTQCDLIITEARSMAKRQEFSAAIDELTAVPSVCEECYRRALAESEIVYQAWRDHVCLLALNKAQAAWANRDSKAAAEALSLVPVDGACYKDACTLRNQIAARLDAKEREEWDFKMQQYEDRIAATNNSYSTAPQSTGATAQHSEAQRAAVREASQAVMPAQPAPQPAYQIKGKWFK